MTPLEWRILLAGLTQPWPADTLQWRAGPTTASKDKAMALPYVDVRAYMDRLDVCAPGAWSTTLDLLGPTTVRCVVTIHGTARASLGEADPSEPNAVTTAEAQATKRAFAAHGVGRYLYSLPRSWVRYDQARKALAEVPTVPAWALPAPIGHGRAARLAAALNDASRPHGLRDAAAWVPALALVSERDGADLLRYAQTAASEVGT